MAATPGSLCAIEHAESGIAEPRTLAAHVEALGGGLEIIADFGYQRIAHSQPGTETG